MAEQLDPRLEARLRAALHDEADAVPFTLRAGDIQRRASLQQRTRRSQRLAILAIAAVVVAAVAGVAGFAALRGPGPTGPDPMAQLASFGELAALSGGGQELLREEARPLTLEGQWQYGLPQGVGNLRIALACSGGSVHLATTADDSPVDDLGTLTGSCDGSGLTVGVGANPRLAAAASASIKLEAPAGTVWRMIVYATAAGPTPAGPPRSQEPGPSAALPTDCTLIRQANQARLGVNSIAGGSATNIGIITYARFGADAPVGSLSAWPITELGLLGAGDGGGLTFYAGRFCVQAWDLSVGQTADIQAALAGGRIPTLQAVPATSSDPHVFAVTGLPVGDLIVRMQTTWATTTGVEALEVRMYRVLVTAPGASSASTHPDPAVPCGVADAAAKAPPALSLYRGDVQLATAAYFTSTWGSVTNDGAETTPATVIDVGDGAGLVVRIAGDACAVAWGVVYAPVLLDGLGFNAIGRLAVQGNHSRDPAIAQENRISLTDLPPGDWLLEASAAFANAGATVPGGNGTVVFRVHVGGAGPSPSPAASVVAGMSLEYTMANGVVIPVRLADPSPKHATIRLATAAERRLGEAALAGGDSSLVAILPRSLLLTWTGTICETGYTLAVNGTQGGIGIFGDARPGCDLARVAFAAVLTWPRAVDLNGFGIQVQPPVLTNN